MKKGPVSLSDPAYVRLAKRINKRWLFMGEEDINWIIKQVLETNALIDRRTNNEYEK